MSIIRITKKSTIKLTNQLKNSNHYKQAKSLLKFLIAGFILINLIQLNYWLTGTSSRILPSLHSIIILAVLLFLFWLVVKERLQTAIWILLAVLTIITFHLLLWRKADSNMIFLLTILIIILSGLLIDNYYALIGGGIIGLFIITLAYWNYFQGLIGGTIIAKGLTTFNDISIYTILMLIVSLTAWMFAYNLRRSLARIKNSEKKLQKKYASLEKDVQWRTEQWLKSEKEKINQLYRLAEFGRLSSGIFHDLINPLTAVALNLEQLTEETDRDLGNTQKYLDQALGATKRMQLMISGIKNQIQIKNRADLFSIDEEISQTIQILSFKARRAGVKINYHCSDKIKLYGNAGQFNQIIINLLANAIEASEDKRKLNNGDPSEQTVDIKLINQSKNILLSVKDDGVGIKKDHLDKIFRPFFSTKTNDGRGLGLGLSLVKDIIEKHFRGQISVNSTENQGSCFTVYLPNKLSPD